MSDTTEAQNIETAELNRGGRKVRRGIVTSDKMDKTIVVTVTSLVRHPLYGKIMKRTKKFKAHDELGQAHVGDTVEMMETRPLSRDKCWRLLKVTDRAK
jgi:small subunit ribosomal protein S17